LPNPIKSSVDDQFPPNGRSAPFCISYCGTFHRASILGLSMAVREEAIGERFIRAKATVAWALSTFAVWKPGAERGKWGGKQSKVDWGGSRRTRPTFAPSSRGAITPLSRSRAFGCCVAKEGASDVPRSGPENRDVGEGTFNIKSRPVVSRGVDSFYVVAPVGSGSGAAPVSCLDRAYLARVACQAPIMSGVPSFCTS
jgi:hypothetical protein